VVIDNYRTIQNICGERLLRQYKHFVVKGLFQQNQIWWRLVVVVVTTDIIFVARGYCDNTNILLREDCFNKIKLVAPSSYLNVLPVCGRKFLQQYIHSVATKDYFNKHGFCGAK
jgi:hypothetical protein